MTIPEDIEKHTPMMQIYFGLTIIATCLHPNAARDGCSS